jgi:hypothetical protein
MKKRTGNFDLGVAESGVVTERYKQSSEDVCAVRPAVKFWLPVSIRAPSAIH